MVPNRTVIALAAALATTAIATAAHAQTGIAVSADLGTAGAGFHLVVPMESNLNGRFGINHFEHDFDTTSGGAAWDAEARLQTFDALFDWYLIDGSPFRLTGGVLYNNNEVTGRALASADGNYYFRGRGYSAASVGTVTAAIDFPKAAPYLGIGWGNALDQGKRWHFNGDLGTFYQGKAKVRMDTSCSFNGIICTVLVSDLRFEQARLGEELGKHKFFPVLRASLSYNF